MSLGKLTVKHWLLIASLVLAIFAYWGGLNELVTRWNKQEEYGHGYFIPLIAIWFLWNRKEALQHSIGSPTWVGTALVAIGSIGLLLGELTAIYVLIQLGFILTLLGLVLAHGGTSLLKVSALPILFLVFAIPLPYFIDAQISWRLQILSSQLGVGFLRLLGTSVFLEGNVIDLGSYKLQVVEACSGLRYLYPLLSIGFLMAYMYKANLWKKVFIFLSTIPITVVMNSARIAMVGILVNKWGSDQAEGFIHYFEGWIIFMICLLILVAEIMLFERFGLKRSFNTAVDLPTIKKVTPKANTFFNLPSYVNIGLLVVSIALVNVLGQREEVVPDRLPLVNFPSVLDGWESTPSSLEKNVIKALQLDDYMIADYAKDNSVVNLYIAYYASQRKGVSPHSPQVCMPGGGWVISSLDRIMINIPGKRDFYVNRTIINKGNVKQVVYYWFEQRGRHIANEYLMKWYLLLDSVNRNRSDGALVRVTTPIKPSESTEEADKRIIEFLQVTAPKMNMYIPE